MKRIATVLCAFALLGVAGTAQADDKCTCSEVKKTGAGWCDACKHGMAFGVEVKSRKLYDAMAGAPVPKDKAEIKCASCKTAAEKNGFCEHCHLAYADGKAYRSTFACNLARGTTIEPAAIECGACKKNLADKKDAFCTACNAGLVNGRMFKTRSAFDGAVLAFGIVKTAIATAGKCETCSIAMVTDGKCQACKIEYKDGKKKAS